MRHFDDIDVDGDKRLSIENIAAALSPVYHHEHDRHAIGGSEHYLSERNIAEITKHELTLKNRTAFGGRPKTIAEIEKNHERQVHKFLLAKDRNRDGKISEKEYFSHTGQNSYYCIPSTQKDPVFLLWL